jgi:hypothetical protein
VPLLLTACSSPDAPPLPPGGGQRLVLSFAQYQQTVAPVLSTQGCDAGGDCHGGGIRGTFALSPVAAKSDPFDFEQASLQVNAYDRDASTLLTKPLAVAAGGVPHSFKPFASTDDPGYQAIRAWIQAGVLQ